MASAVQELIFKINVCFYSDRKCLQLLLLFGCVTLKLKNTRKQLSVLDIPCLRV